MQLKYLITKLQTAAVQAESAPEMALRGCAMGGEFQDNRELFPMHHWYSVWNGRMRRFKRQSQALLTGMEAAVATFATVEGQAYSVCLARTDGKTVACWFSEKETLRVCIKW